MFSFDGVSRCVRHSVRHGAQVVRVALPLWGSDTPVVTHSRQGSVQSDTPGLLPALRRDDSARNFENALRRSASGLSDALGTPRFGQEITTISGQSPLRAPGFAGAIAAALRIKSPPEAIAS